MHLGRSAASAIGVAAIPAMASIAFAQDLNVCRSLIDGGQLVDRGNSLTVAEAEYQDFRNFCKESTRSLDKAKSKSSSWQGAVKYVAKSVDVRGGASGGSAASDSLSEAELNRACEADGKRFREYFYSQVDWQSGAAVAKYFADCIKILSDSNVDALVGEVWADAEDGKFHAKITRTVRSPVIEYIYGGVSDSIDCTPTAASDTRTGAADQKRERLSRLVKPEYGLFCKAKDVKNAPITGQFSLLAYDPGTDSLSGARRTVSFTVVPGSLRRQFEQTFEQRLQEVINASRGEIGTLRAELLDQIERARLGIENFELVARHGIATKKGEVSVAQCGKQERLAAGSCIGGLAPDLGGGGQAAVGPFFWKTGGGHAAVNSPDPNAPPKGEPIAAVECRGYADNNVVAFAVCLRLNK